VPATTRAHPVTDEYPTRLEPVTAWAVLRRTHHPFAVGAADQIADGGHQG
jgi:hypothetical protein